MYGFLKFPSYVCKCTHTYVFTVVIRGPNDATVCKEGSTTFTCVLDRNHEDEGENVLLNNDDIQWYRAMTGTSATIEVDPQGSNIHFTTSTNNSTLTSNLTVTNAMKSYTGRYWVGTPYYSDCYVSLTVTTSTYVKINANHLAYIATHDGFMFITYNIYHKFW